MSGIGVCDFVVLSVVEVCADYGWCEFVPWLS